MTTKKRQFGDLGEEIACRYLKNKGFSILGRNYLKPYGEIDIIGKLDGVIHFIEVKSVTREIYDSQPKIRFDEWNPAELIHPKKLQRMHKAIGSYLLENNIELDWQIDGLIVEIDEERKRSRIEFIEGIS